MLPEDFKINLLVEVEIGEDADYLKRYKTRVEGLADDSIQLAIPIENGALVPIHRGDVIKVSYMVKKDYNQVYTYSFMSRVRSRYQDPIPIISIDLPERVTKVQRRNYLRLPLAVKVQLYRDKSEDPIPGVTVDLSGGGSLVSSDQPFEEGDTVRMVLALPGRPVFEIGCEVKRVTSREENGKTRYNVALKFDQIREGERDQIISYIFDKQRENIRKRLVQ